jgi:cell division protein FtsB
MDNKKSSKGGFLTFFILIISIAGFAALGTFTYILYDENQDLEDTVSTYEETIEQNESDIVDLRDRLEVLELQIEDLEDGTGGGRNNQDDDILIPSDDNDDDFPVIIPNNPGEPDDNNSSGGGSSDTDNGTSTSPDNNRDSSTDDQNDSSSRGINEDIAEAIALDAVGGGRVIDVREGGRLGAAWEVDVLDLQDQLKTVSIDSSGSVIGIANT